MFETDALVQGNDETARFGPESVDLRLVQLIGVATVFGIGHHLDHIIRGNHVGWPLIPELTPFTYTLAIYPLIAIGLYLTVTERVGAGYWSVLLAVIFVAVTTTHFGPWAAEPPGDIVGPYERPAVGYVALAWLFGLVGSLGVATLYAIRCWLRARGIIG